MNEDTAGPVRREVTGAADALARAGRSLDTSGAVSPAERVADQEALVDLASTGHRLARVLDTLAHQYSTPGTAQPTAAHVALDQAAAAAEDLGKCSGAAARAIEDRE